MTRFSCPILPLLLTATLTLTACGGGSGTDSSAELPPGKDVVTPAFESYTTSVGSPKWNRVLLSKPQQSGDAAALAAFDGPAANPAGYLRYDLAGADYDGDMIIEVIAALDSSGKKVNRLLRLTADQSQFVAAKSGEAVSADGKYYFKGGTFAWVTIDNQPMLSGSHSEGLTNLVIDFKNETASINLRTEVSDSSEVEITLVGTDLPFNIRTGAYGGDITLAVRDPNSPLVAEIDGSLRGNVGGNEKITDSTHGMTTSGVYTGSGTDGGMTVSVDGIYFGRDPNAIK